MPLTSSWSSASRWISARSNDGRTLAQQRVNSSTAEFRAIHFWSGVLDFASMSNAVARLATVFSSVDVSTTSIKPL